MHMVVCVPPPARVHRTHTGAHTVALPITMHHFCDAVGGVEYSVTTLIQPYLDNYHVDAHESRRNQLGPQK